MKAFVSCIYAAATFSTLAVGASIPRYLERSPTTPANLDSNKVQRELGTRVSKGTVIFGPTDARFPDATSRWNTFAVPQIRAVIEPAQESDVPIIVSVANDCIWFTPAR